MSLGANLHQDWKDFIQSLIDNQVDFLIVGAFAVGFHELPRTTGDMDFFVGHDAENARRLRKAIREFGYGHIQVPEEAFTQPNTMLTLGIAPCRIDVMTDIDSVPFGEAWAKRVEGDLGQFRVSFLSREHLLRKKEAIGREKDQKDIRRLRKSKL